MSNDLGLDQDTRSVGPDLGPNCLQRLSADDKSMEREKIEILPRVVELKAVVVLFSKNYSIYILNRKRPTCGLKRTNRNVV